VSNNSDVNLENHDRPWWPVVLEVAQMMTEGWSESDIFDDKFGGVLRDRGYVVEAVEAALNWFEKARLSGFLSESLGMLQPQQSHHQRLMSTYETVGLPKVAISAIESLRSKAIISGDVVEKLIEGLRVIDTRDWDDDDVLRVIQEFIATALPYQFEAIESLEELERALPRYYS